MTTVLIIDDEEAISWGLSQVVQQLGAAPIVASSAEEAFAIDPVSSPDVIILDVRLPGLDGIAAMPRLRRKWPNARFIVITAFGDLEIAVKAVREGAVDYVVKPFDVATISRVLERAITMRRESADSVDVATAAQAVEGFVGQSAAMQQVYAKIALAANSNAGVLLRGESGTGKELAARAIHRFSERATGPFVAVNVAAFAPDLIASELFGHVRGAFTGANDSRPGLLQLAHGGTLFLDEIGEAQPDIQVKLLRAIEQKEVWPVGADHPVPCDFRLISATHQNLLAAIESGSFRADLYYRIACFEIVLPPLRERLDDVESLALHFLEDFSKSRHSTPRISPAAIEALKRRPWHGNIRELRNAIEHAFIVSRGQIIAPEHLPQPLDNFPSVASARTVDDKLRQSVRDWCRRQLEAEENPTDLYKSLLDTIEPTLFDEVLASVQGNMSEASRRLGIHRTTLKRKSDQNTA